MKVAGNRRAFLAGMALAPVAGVAAGSNAGQNGDDPGLAAAFGGLVQSLQKGDLPGFYGVMHERFVMIDEDSPWRMSKQAFEEHIGFHVSGVWDSFAWFPIDVTARVFGTTGVVAGTATFRGKPKDAGFRLRPLLFSQAWVQVAGKWQLINWHQSPIIGLVNQASPG